jgi:putative methionine-R-sulfoxide reductase with GAF domain
MEGVLRASLAIGIVAVLSGSYFAYRRQDLRAIPVYWGMYALLVLIAVWRRLPYDVRAGGLLLLAYAVGIADLLAVGKGGESRLFLLVVPFLATLFFGWRGGGLSLALAGLTMVGFGWAFSAGYLAAPTEEPSSSLNPYSWLINTVVLLLLGSLIAVSLTYVLDHVIPTLRRALARSRSLTQDLEQHRNRLLERAQALKRKALHLEISADVGRTITSILDTDQLLHETVELIHDRFGWYLVAIFLLDESGDQLHLAAAAGEVGAQVLSQGLQLPVAETNLVGRAAKRRRPRVASNVADYAAHQPYPLLPRTTSEVALPLVVGDRLLGVLDIESRESAAFNANDVKILQGLADQVAIAIRNADRVQGETALLETTSATSRESTSDGGGGRG